MVFHVIIWPSIKRINKLKYYNISLLKDENPFFFIRSKIKTHSFYTTKNVFNRLFCYSLKLMKTILLNNQPGPQAKYVQIVY